MTAEPHGVFEALLGVGHDGRGVVLYDVSELLPYHRTKRYRGRSLDVVRAQYVHHSGTLRQGDPFEHMKASARYAIRHHGWPGFCYHIWYPLFDVFDSEGSRVIYRGNPDTIRTYHAGQAPNYKGIAHCLQGNLSTKDMSEAQLCTLPVALRWYAHRLAVSPRPFGHFQATDGHAKDSCPGRAGKAWCLGYQAARRIR